MQIRLLEDVKHHRHVAGKKGEVLDVHETHAADLEQHGFAEFVLVGNAEPAPPETPKRNRTPRAPKPKPE